MRTKFWYHKTGYIYNLWDLGIVNSLSNIVFIVIPLYVHVGLPENYSLWLNLQSDVKSLPHLSLANDPRPLRQTTCLYHMLTTDHPKADHSLSAEILLRVIYTYEDRSQTCKLHVFKVWGQNAKAINHSGDLIKQFFLQKPGRGQPYWYSTS